MNPETEAQIRNVVKFGKIARLFCALLSLMVVVFTWWSFSNIVAGPKSPSFTFALGGFYITADNLATLPAKAWTLTVLVLLVAIMSKGLFHLYLVFSSLAHGSIYTRDNVNHIRQIGLLALGGAILQVIVSLITNVLTFSEVIVTSPVADGQARLGFFSFDTFIFALLLLLASWIMEIGRRTTDEADTLRREAELVI